jgi:hypothetical protein
MTCQMCEEAIPNVGVSRNIHSLVATCRWADDSDDAMAVEEPDGRTPPFNVDVETGGIDLSVGSVSACGSVLGAKFLSTMPVGGAVAMAILIGCAMGEISGECLRSS